MVAHVSGNAAVRRIHEQHVGGEAWRKAEARGIAEHLAWAPPAELARYRGTAA